MQLRSLITCMPMYVVHHWGPNVNTGYTFKFGCDAQILGICESKRGCGNSTDFRTHPITTQPTQGTGNHQICPRFSHDVVKHAWQPIETRQLWPERKDFWCKIASAEVTQNYMYEMFICWTSFCESLTTILQRISVLVHVYMYWNPEVPKHYGHRVGTRHGWVWPHSSLSLSNCISLHPLIVKKKTFPFISKRKSWQQSFNESQCLSCEQRDPNPTQSIFFLAPATPLHLRCLELWIPNKKNWF